MNEAGGTFQPKTAVQRAISLREVEAFRSVPMEELAYIASAAREEWYPSGSVLFREGDPPGALFVILDQALKLKAAETRQLGIEAQLVQAGQFNGQQFLVPAGVEG